MTVNTKYVILQLSTQNIILQTQTFILTHQGSPSVFFKRSVFKAPRPLMFTVDCFPRGSAMDMRLFHSLLVHHSGPAKPDRGKGTDVRIKLERPPDHRSSSVSRPGVNRYLTLRFYLRITCFRCFLCELLCFLFLCAQNC